MTLNGSAIESFEDVERELRKVRTENADGIGEVLSAVGALTVEVAGLQRGQDELRRVIVERGIGTVPPMRQAMDTGSHSLVEAWAGLKDAAADKRHPLSSDRARAIAEKAIEDMKAATELSTWRRIKAMPMWALKVSAKKAIEWLIPLIIGGVAVEIWRLFHK